MATPAPDSDTESPPNPPPFITPPPTNPCSRIPQVTQSQTEDDALNTADANLTPFQEDHDTYIHYHDPDLVLQTPARHERHTSVPVAPIVYSPERNKINAMEEVTKSSEKSQNKRKAGRKSMEKMQKCQKMVVNHSAVNNIFHFIRNKFFDSMEDTSPDLKMSRFDTIVRTANSHWKGNLRNKLSFEPFDESMQSALESSSVQLLTHEHHRLLLEEMMLLEDGSVFTCTISSKHYLLQQSCPTSMIKKSLQALPTRPLILDRMVYYMFNLTVQSNPKLEAFTYGMMGSREAIINECTKQGGCGLNCEFQATGDQILIKFQNLIDHPKDIMFWSSTHSMTRLSHIRRKLKDTKDPKRMAIVAIRYLEEFYGDAVPTINIIGHVQTFVKEKETTAIAKVIKTSDVSTERLVNCLDLKASDPAFVTFRDFVDHTCLDALDSMYGDFTGFTSPIFSQRKLSAISDMFKSTLPTYYHALSSMLNKSSKTNVSRFKSLQGQWDCNILYQFLTICRKRNNHIFADWALINTASSYDGTNLDLQVFFGLAVTITTMLKKLNARYPFEYIMRKTMNTLASIDEMGICVFDNSQMIRSLKFQCGGRSSKFSLATSRLFLQAKIPNLLSLYQWPEEKVPLTYINQRIPSPPGMAMYEGIKRITPSIFDGKMVCSSQMDLSGSRVDAWASLAMLSSQIYKLQCLVKIKDNERFQFQHDDNIACMKRLCINSKLQKNRDGLYSKVKHFQFNETKKWRGQPQDAHVIIPPASPHDKTTNSGAAKVILSLLTMFGVLKKVHDAKGNGEDDACNDKIKNLVLAPDAKERFLVMVGDRLTQIRAKQFTDMIKETSTSYGPRHRVTQMLQKALDQVIFIPGDLHGGGFHIMQVIYNLFYGTLLQKLQAVLKWKRICGTDVSKCYQQSTSLASIVATEVDQQLLAEHFRGVYYNQEQRFQFNAIRDHEQFAIHVAQSYSGWIQDRRRLTTDQNFRMILNFVSIMNLYRLFCVGVQMGDAIIVEWTYREMVSLFHATGKKHYYEIDLRQMEDLYSRIPYKYLHLVRINRTVPLYSGFCKYDDDKMWGYIDQCTVELISESEKQRAERMVCECQTEEEILLDKFTDSLYNVAEQNADNEPSDEGTVQGNRVVDLTEGNNKMDEGGIEFEMDPRVMADNLDVDRDDDDDARDVQVEEAPVEINVRGIGNIKKAAINPLAINHDVIHYAKAKVEKLNLKEIRVRERERKLRKKDLANDVMAAIIRHKDTMQSNGEMEGEDHITNSFERHVEAIIGNGDDTN